LISLVRTLVDGARRKTRGGLGCGVRHGRLLTTPHQGSLKQTSMSLRTEHRCIIKKRKYSRNLKDLKTMMKMASERE